MNAHASVLIFRLARFSDTRQVQPVKIPHSRRRAEQIHPRFQSPDSLIKNPVFIKGHILRDFPEVLKSLPLIERGIVRSGIQPASIFRSQIPPVRVRKILSAW